MFKTGDKIIVHNAESPVAPFHAYYISPNLVEVDSRYNFGWRGESGTPSFDSGRYWSVPSISYKLEKLSTQDYNVRCQEIKTKK